MGSVDDLHRWMVSYSSQIKSLAQPGALPQSARDEYNKFLVSYFIMKPSLRKFI